jgi:hypothetical protein
MQKQDFTKTASNRFGQSLIQVMIAAAVMAILIVQQMSMQAAQQKAAVATQTVISRNMMQIQLQQNLVSPISMQNTLADVTDPGNVALATCLQPVGNSCVQTTAAQGFYLIDVLKNKVAGSGSSSPLLYDYNGALCTTPSPQCLFQVFTTYSAVCPGGVSPCSNPIVTGMYTIQQNPAVTNPVGGTPLRVVTSQPIPLTSSGFNGKFQIINQLLPTSIPNGLDQTWNWPSAWPDTNYAVVCQGGKNDVHIGYCYTGILSINTTSVTTRTSRAGTGPCDFDYMYCIGVHN